LKREGAVQPKPYAKAKPPKAKKDTHTDGKGKSESQPIRDRDIKCFKCLGKGHIASQCQNRRVMLTRDNREVESESDKSKVKRCHLWWIVVMRRLHILLRRGGLGYKTCAEHANQRR